MTAGFEKHCDDATLELYALNQLDGANTEVLEEHILICEACRQRLDEMDRYVQAMKAASARLRREPEESSGGLLARAQEWLRFRPIPIWAGAAAMVCLAIALSAVYLRTSVPADESVYAVTLTASRGAEQDAVPAGRRLDLKLDTRGLSESVLTRVELVDSRGELVERASPASALDTIDFRPKQTLKAGAYFVRLYGASADPLREFELSVK